LLLLQNIQNTPVKSNILCRVLNFNQILLLRVSFFGGFFAFMQMMVFCQGLINLLHTETEGACMGLWQDIWDTSAQKVLGTLCDFIFQANL
jgi:hypothetical protein